ncbi:hypothetical protein ACFPZN_34355, partial [Actinomadura rugatobispora]
MTSPGFSSGWTSTTLAAEFAKEWLDTYKASQFVRAEQRVASAQRQVIRAQDMSPWARQMAQRELVAANRALAQQRQTQVDRTRLGLTEGWQRVQAAESAAQRANGPVARRTADRRLTRARVNFYRSVAAAEELDRARWSRGHGWQFGEGQRGGVRFTRSGPVPGGGRGAWPTLGAGADSARPGSAAPRAGNVRQPFADTGWRGVARGTLPAPGRNGTSPTDQTRYGWRGDARPAPGRTGARPAGDASTGWRGNARPTPGRARLPQTGQTTPGWQGDARGTTGRARLAESAGERPAGVLSLLGLDERPGPEGLPAGLAAS